MQAENTTDLRETDTKNVSLPQLGAERKIAVDRSTDIM